MVIKNFTKINHPLTKVIGCKTIREKNGIAYSSRNILLTRTQKIIASKVYKILKKNKKNLIKSNFLLKKIKNEIFDLGVGRIDYIEVLNKSAYPPVKMFLYFFLVSFSIFEIMLLIKQE